MCISASVRTSHKQHLASLLHSLHIILILVVYNVNRLFYVAEHEVAMAVVCLRSRLYQLLYLSPFAHENAAHM